MRGRSYTVSDYLLGSFISMGVVQIDQPQSQSDDEYEFPIDEPQENKAITHRRAGRPKKS